MTSMRSVGGFFIACLAASILAGCELTRMRVDPALAGVPALKVEGAGLRTPSTPIRFGDWHTADMRTGRETTEVSGFFIENQRSEQPARFVLMTPSGAIAAECLTSASFDAIGNLVEIDVAQMRGEPKFRCRFGGATEGTMTLVAQRTLGESISGPLEFDADRWTVTSTSAVENAHSSGAGSVIVGYEIRRDATVVASVETINGGRVWISSECSQLDQDRYAAAITALLTFRELSSVRDD